MLKRNTNLLLKMIILIIISLIFMNACGFLQTYEYDDSILTQEICQFPCWHGLFPGRSSIYDVYALIDEDSFIPENRINRYQDADETILYWRDTPVEQSRFIFKNGILHSIEISPHIEFSLEETLDIYGAPSAVRIMIKYGPHNEIEIEVNTYYPQNGLVITFEFEGDTTIKEYKISPDILGTSFKVCPSSFELRDFISVCYDVQGSDLENHMRRWIIEGWPGLDSIIIKPEFSDYPLDSPIPVLTVTPIPF